MSQDYLIADFEPFINDLISHHGKTQDNFKFQKLCINLLGKIPLQITERVDVKSLPIAAFKNAANEECIF